MSKLLSDATAAKVRALVADERGTAIASRPGYWRTPYPFGKGCTFGLGLNANTVTIYNARARRYGERNLDGTNKIWTCADTTITLSDGAGQRIVWEWSETGGLSIRPAAQSNDPGDETNYLRGIVCILDCTDSVITLAANIGATDQLGHLLILPVFAPKTV